MHFIVLPAVGILNEHLLRYFSYTTVFFLTCLFIECRLSISYSFLYVCYSIKKYFLRLNFLSLHRIVNCSFLFYFSSKSDASSFLALYFSDKHSWDINVLFIIRPWILLQWKQEDSILYKGFPAFVWLHANVWRNFKLDSAEAESWILNIIS